MRTHGSATVDYDAMDGLIRKGKTTREIMATLGCSKTVVNDRKRKAGLGRKTSSTPKEIHYEIREAIVPPAERAELLLRHKAREIGQSMNWMRTHYVNGQAWKQTLEQL